MTYSPEQRRARYVAAKEARYRAAWRGTHCAMRVGQLSCGTRLVEGVDALGRVVAHCPSCVRKLKGVCRTCPAQVAGRGGYAVYCAPCKKEAERAEGRRYVSRNLAKRADYNRLYRRRKRKPMAEIRAQRSQAAKKKWTLWRKARAAVA